MFYIKSQHDDLYFTGEFDRSLPPDPYLGTLDEALEFQTYDDALNYLQAHVLGGKIIEDKDVPEVDFWKSEHHKAREQLREILNAAAFLWDSATEEQKKRFFEAVKEICCRN